MLSNKRLAVDLTVMCKTRFDAFAERAFRILEPGIKYEWNWHIGCIAEHLEANLEGELPWLIINLPPRQLKSTLVAQLWPPFVLGRQPHHQFIGASYAASLSERNVVNARKVMNDAWYREVFPDAQLDIERQDYFTTKKNGQYKGTGIGGTVTGFGCFVGETLVLTDGGLMPIDNIKLGENANQCLSFNHEKGSFEWKDIEAFRAIMRDDIYEITTATGSFQCTGNHPIYIEGCGYTEAKNIKKGQILVKAYPRASGRFNLSLLSKAIYAHWIRIRQSNPEGSKAILLLQTLFAYVQEQAGYARQEMRQMRQRVQPSKTWKLCDKVLQRLMRFWFSKTAEGFSLPQVWQNIYGNKLAQAVLQPSLCECPTFNKDERYRKPKIYQRESPQRRVSQNKAFNLGKRWDALRELCGRVYSGKTEDKSCGSSHRRGCTSQRAAKSDNFMRLLPHFSSQREAVLLVEKVRTGSVPVYDLQIADNNNFFANGFLVHNCNTLILDDPINPKEAASDTIRNHTNEEIRSTLFSRFNDRRDAHFVGIMQRTHEDDPTGNLARDPRYYVLKLPAEAKKRIYIPALKAGHDWQMEAGELLTERLTQKDLAELRDDLGEYNYVGQYLQEPVPVGGGEFKNKWVQHYQDGGVKPKTMNICILGDPSAGEENNKKKKKLSDFTAFMVVGLAPDNNYYLLDIVRDRLNPTERVETLFMLHRKWNALAGKPPRVGYEKYGMMSDNHYIKAKMREDGYNFHMVELGGKVDKESRIRRLIPDMEGGRWYFPANLQYVDNEGRSFDLVRELEMSEMPTFPKARFDDMLDALSRVYDEDMMMNFPRPKQTEKQKMLSSAFKDESGGDWMDF